MSTRILATSADWQLCAEFEAIWVTDDKGQRWCIGEMYGNPETGLITWDGRYAVVIGCGILVADLERFGELMLSHQSWPIAPIAQILCDLQEQLHFEPLCVQVEQDDQVYRIRVVTDLLGESPGIYELRLPSLQFIRLQ